MNFLLPRQYAIIALTILSLALGGTTALWAQAIMAILAGMLILLAPPHQSLGKAPNILFLLLLALALTAFLPAAWTTLPSWRQHMVEDLHVPLPSTRTPQPWLTLQACSLLFIGMVWAYYVLSQKWNSAQRLTALRLLVPGVAILAIITLVTYALGVRVPGWNQEQNRGWFPNRNQTADVLALCGIVNYALIFDRLRKSRSSGYFWMATLVPITVALVISYSRAGILLFFVGIGLWHLWPSRHRKLNRSTIKWTSLSMALGFMLLAFFLLFGGETLERFQNHSAPQPLAQQKSDYRIFIQKDAFNFSLQAPWLGIGLGNFEALFPIARHASVDQNRAIHPESDWLWAACELGWPATLLVLIGAGWWIQRCFPFEAKSGESLRRAMVVAVVIFLLHGFADVSGHRVGSLWFALLLASMAMSPSPVSIPVLGGGVLLFRSMAVVFFVIAGWWLASLNGLHVPPTTADLSCLEDRIKTAVKTKQIEPIEGLSNAALRIAPVNWIFYFQRAYTEAFQRGHLSQAITDFQVARTLEPHWSKLCLDEGAVWLSVNQPDLCMDAWREAIQRDPSNEADLYNRMIGVSLANPLVFEYLKDFALEHRNCLPVFLAYASPDDAKKAITELLATDPRLESLTPEQRNSLFQLWWAKGDRASLILQLTSHKEWLSSGWPYLSLSYAQQKDFQQAWETVARFSQAPVTIPALATDRPVADLERDFYSHPDNIANGIMLVLAEIKAGQTDNALAALRTMEKLPTHPKYVFYLEARMWAEKQQWELAWEAWSNFNNP